MTTPETVDLSTPAGHALARLSQDLRGLPAGGGWTGADLVTLLGSSAPAVPRWVPALGTVVQLRPHITAGYLTRAGTVVGCGAVHPGVFPYNDPGQWTGAHTVVLVTTGPVVSAWTLDLVEPGPCLLDDGHAGACQAGEPRRSDQHARCRRSGHRAGHVADHRNGAS